MLTLKNENNSVEKLLKNKMDELANSVDCFDRISAKAFPEKNKDFSESGFTVSDLENVTAKAKRTNIIRWTAVVAAAVVCIAVIPQTNLINNIFSNMGSVKKSYENLIAEIETETKNDDYLSVDYSLDYYIQNDVLVTPLFVCPFEDCGKEDANIRIYTRMINGFCTNQVYAVEYVGDFSEENIIAAAKSEYTFSAEDVEFAEQFSIYDFSEYSCTDAIARNFSTNSDGLFIDNENNAYSLASFMDFSLIKYNGGVMPVSSTVLYGHQTMNDEQYFYDIMSLTVNGEEIQITERDKFWGTSVYFNGNNAMPDENHSMFSEKDLFNSSSEILSECLFVYPFNDGYIKESTDEIISLYDDQSGKRLSAVIIPSDNIRLLTTCLYFSHTNDGMSVYVKSNNGFHTYYPYDILPNEIDMEEYNREIEEMRKQLEENEKQMITYSQ